MTVLFTLASATLIITPLICLLLLAVRRLGERYTAQSRYVMWVLVMAGLVLPLVFAGGGPVVQIDLHRPIVEEAAPAPPPALHGQAYYEPAQPLPDLDIGQPAALLPQAETTAQSANLSLTPTPSPNDNTRNWPAVGLAEILMLVWLAGAGALAVVYAVSHIRFHRFVKRWHRTETEAFTRHTFEQVCAEMGIRGNIRLARCKGISAPMLMGIFRPTVLLPVSDYESCELRLIFRHELTHYKRRDLWFKLALAAIKCVHWFNPAVHMMARQAEKDIEIICDGFTVLDMDLQTRTRYGALILNLAAGLGMRKGVLTTHLFGGKHMLKHRLTTIMSNGKKNGRKLFALLGIAVAATCVLVGFNFRPERLAPGPRVEAETNAQMKTLHISPVIPPRPAFNTPAPNDATLNDIMSDMPAWNDGPETWNAWGERMREWGELLREQGDAWREWGDAWREERDFGDRFNAFSEGWRIYEDLETLHAMVYDEPRISDVVLDGVTSLRIDVASSGFDVRVTTGGDHLIIRFPEMLENQFIVAVENGQAHFYQDIPYHHIPAGGDWPDFSGIVQNMQTMMTDITYNGWLQLYLRDNDIQVPPIEIIIPQGMALEAVNISTSGRFVEIDNVDISAYLRVHSMTGTDIRVSNSIFRNDVRLSTGSGDVYLDDSVFEGIRYIQATNGRVYR